MVVLGDAVYAFNPVYGQGMTVAALGALTLDKCLHQQFRRDNGNLTGLQKRFQKRLAQANSTPWLMATGEDFRWSTTEGGQVEGMSQLMHQYIDRVMLLALDHPKLHQTFGEVAHMVRPPTALFQPGILAQVLRHAVK